MGDDEMIRAKFRESWGWLVMVPAVAAVVAPFAVMAFLGEPPPDMSDPGFRQWVIEYGLVQNEERRQELAMAIARHHAFKSGVVLSNMYEVDLPATICSRPASTLTVQCFLAWTPSETVALSCPGWPPPAAASGCEYIDETRGW